MTASEAGNAVFRLADAADLGTVVALTEQVYAPYQAFGYRETGRRPNTERPGWILMDMVKELPGD